MLKTIKAVEFLFKAPLILAFLLVVNWMTTPGHWWVQWAALGLGFAWMKGLFRVLTAIVLVGGVAVLAAMVWKHYQNRSVSDLSRA